MNIALSKDRGRASIVPVNFRQKSFKKSVANSVKKGNKQASADVVVIWWTLCGRFRQ